MKIKINNPCPEDWEAMQDYPEGKFCDKCSKCVVDFTDKTNDEVQDIFNDANGKEICGRISSSNLFAKTAAGIILITNLTFTQAQVKSSFNSDTEQRKIDATKLSGRLVFKETQKVIPNAEVIFIDKSTLLKTTTNENGYFSFEIPNDLIESENVLYFNFDKLNEIIRKENKARDSISMYDYGNQSVIFSRKEKIENKKFQIDYGGVEIGAVVIVENPPPDYYYFNGKDIGKEKFEILKKENPQYQYFSFYGKEAEVISKDSFIDTLYLMYSK